GPPITHEILQPRREAVARIAREQPQVLGLPDHDARELRPIGRIESAGERLAVPAGGRARMRAQGVRAARAVHGERPLPPEPAGSGRGRRAGAWKLSPPLWESAPGWLRAPLADRPQPPVDSTTVTASLGMSVVSSIACAASRSMILVRRSSPYLSASARISLA